MQKSFIAKKLDIKNEDFLLMIPELYTSVASCFPVKVITKNMALFQFCIYFGILVLLDQKKGDIGKLSRPGFICKQKGNTCTTKLQEIHSQTQRKIFSFGFHIKGIIMLQFFKLHGCTFTFLQEKIKKFYFDHMAHFLLLDLV